MSKMIFFIRNQKEVNTSSIEVFILDTSDERTGIHTKLLHKNTMQQYMQQHGTSYYIANMFFPKELREKVFTLYAFVRVPDDLVDKP